MSEQTTPDAVTPPAGNPRFPALDGVRAFAAIAVVLFHADQFTSARHTIIGHLFWHAEIGVTVFFLITGFLLYRPMFAAAVGDAPPTPAALFYRRRILRIVPAYWIALLVLGPLLIYARPLGLPNIFFGQIYRPRWARSGIPPGWSVCVEMSFYLLLPLYARILQWRWGSLDREERRGRELRLLGVLAVASLAFREMLLLGHVSPYLADPLPGTLAWFCVGMCLAVTSVQPHPGSLLRRLAAHPCSCWCAAVGLYGATLLTPDESDQSVIVFSLYGAIALLILLPVVLSPPGNFTGGRLLQTPLVTWLGLVSYGIYLYHYPIEQHLHVSTGSTAANFALVGAIGVTVGVACGALSYYTVERQALRLKNASSLHRRLRPSGVS
jgi:peptidoglycan/LPS O-acetylase OafA/YrhL